MTTCFVVAIMCSTVGWGMALVMAAFAVTHHSPADGRFVAGTATYVVSSALCHQQVVRSFFAWGVCRCQSAHDAAARMVVPPLRPWVSFGR